MSAAEPTATWRVRNLELGLEESESCLRDRALEVAGLGAGDLRGFRIAHKALDARKTGGRRRLRFVVHVDLVTDPEPHAESFRKALRSGRVVPAPIPGSLDVSRPHGSVRGKVAVVVGSGPGGMFAALALARNGVRVELIDRGAPLEERGRDLVAFHRSRVPNPESNLLFGEGGAGTYSDGKLYTRKRDPLVQQVYRDLVASGWTIRSRSPASRSSWRAARRRRSCTTLGRTSGPTGCTASSPRCAIGSPPSG